MYGCPFVKIVGRGIRPDHVNIHCVVLFDSYNDDILRNVVIVYLSIHTCTLYMSNGRGVEVELGEVEVELQNQRHRCRAIFPQSINCVSHKTFFLSKQVLGVHLMLLTSLTSMSIIGCHLGFQVFNESRPVIGS